MQLRPIGLLHSDCKTVCLRCVFCPCLLNFTPAKRLLYPILLFYPGLGLCAFDAQALSHHGPWLRPPKENRESLYDRTGKLQSCLGLGVMAFCSGCILLASAFARALKDAIVPMASASCAFLWWEHRDG